MSTTKLGLPEKMRLSFDPSDSKNPAFKEDPLLAKVWEDSLARNIWLCYAAQHIRDQDHTRTLLFMVRELREDGHPRSPAHLAGFVKWLTPYYAMSNVKHDIEFAQLIWPYTTGEKDMQWEVVEK